MFKALGIVVALYTLWSAVDGKVYARAGNWQGGRYIVKADELRYFWTVIVIYGVLSVALLTVF
jgi:type IV secretory pathway component VirB8